MNQKSTMKKVAVAVLPLVIKGLKKYWNKKQARK